MRRLAVPLLLSLALAQPASAASASLFLISGRGFGHGVGMSQYGAYGFALQGWTYDRILAYYYPGTVLGSAAGPRVRVLLAERRDALTIGSHAPFTATDAAGRSVTLVAGVYRLGPTLELRLGAQVVVLAGPIRFEPGGTPLEILGRPYRGSLLVSSDGRSLSAVNELPLEEYLYGVLPREMPPAWAPEALKAQAVASRSYALTRRRAPGPFELYADERSQVYGGIAAEDLRTTVAVDATAGQVLLYQGRPASTFFFSSSGGRTAAVGDVWPGSAPLPYLVSVDDPYDTLSPYHEWGPLVFGGGQLAARLGRLAPPGLTDLTVTLNGSGRAASVTAVGTAGPVQIPAAAFSSRIGLRSTWFSIAVLALRSAPSQVAYGQQVSLSGFLRGVPGATLEQRPWGGSWRPLAPVAVAADGSFGAVAGPVVTTVYRLAVAGAAGAAVRVPVAPTVSLAAEPGAGLTGRVQPTRAGTRVEIERREGARWRTVATAITDPDGSFRLAPGPALEAGMYRARVPAGGGLASGASAPLPLGSG